MEKMKLLKKMKHRVRIAKNEKTLLTLLGMVIIFWVIFRFVITPQHTKLEILINEKIDYENQVLQINKMLKEEKDIKKQWEDLYQENILLSNKFFSNMNQSKIINLLGEIFNTSGIEVLDINFNKPVEEHIEDIPIYTMDIDIPYRSDYKSLVEATEAIRLNPKNMIITDLIIDRTDENSLAGNISVKVYALERIRKVDNEEKHIDNILKGEKSDPFTPFKDYSISIEEKTPINIEESTWDSDYEIEKDEVEEKYSKELLEDFEYGDFNFIPSSQYVKGHIYKSLNSKSNKYAMRFEYNILGLDDKNRAYLDLSNKNIVIKYPPSSVGLWIYSYGYSPVTLGLKLKGQANEKIDVELSKGVSWLGWKYIEVKLPSDLALYPLQLDKLYVDLPYNRDDYGVLLFDRIEANYPKGNSRTAESFDFYMVEKDDTLDKISMKFYGTIKKKNIIIQYNEIKSDRDMKEGKILVIPR